MVIISEKILSEFQNSADAGKILEDSQCVGFVARKNVNGSVSFLKKISMHGKERQFMLGKYQGNNLEEMRAKAEAMTEDKFVSYR